MSLQLSDEDILETAFQTRYQNQVGIFVRHWRVFLTNGTGITDAQVSTFLYTEFKPHVRALLNENALFEQLRVQRIFPGFRGLTQTSSGLPNVGLVGGDILPSQTSGLITLQTNFAGRKFRGRVYVPFPGEADNTAAGLPSADYQTRLETLAAALNTGYLVGDLANNAIIQPVLWHRAPRTWTALVSTRSNPRWATQRRRGSYGHPNV